MTNKELKEKKDFQLDVSSFFKLGNKVGNPSENQVFRKINIFFIYYIFQHPDDLEISSLASPLYDHVFELLYLNNTSVKLPLGWNRSTSINKPEIVVYFQLLSKESNGVVSSVILPVFGKTVIVDYRGKVQCNYLGKNLSVQLLLPSYDFKLDLTIEILTLIISQFHNKDICEGVDVKDTNLKFKSETVYTDATYKWRHKNCSIILSEHNKKICNSCNSVNQLFSNKKYRRKFKPLKRISLKVTPSKKENLGLLRKRIYSKQRTNKTLGKKIVQLEAIIEDYKNKLANINEESILQKISSHTHKLLVHEILAASKCKNACGNRYSDNWIMLCLLLHIKSPSGYSFLRNNNIMPLPCVRTVRNYLSTINTSCGFDDNFFELFKKRLKSKNIMQRHGLIVFDEISVRENLAVKSHSLSYAGLVDFGKEDETCTELPKATTLDDLANHGLVLLFQPLADNYSQPIAVFASRGPVKGLTLVKLLIKATILLEKAGALIHGFISDSALTNRKVWSELGISGKLNNCNSHIEHFNDPKRKFFAFSDTSHLIKNVRNRIYNKHELVVCIKLITCHYIFIYVFIIML